jgi:hypothetical protein
LVSVDAIEVDENVTTGQILRKLDTVLSVNLSPATGDTYLEIISSRVSHRNRSRDMGSDIILHIPDHGLDISGTHFGRFSVIDNFIPCKHSQQIIVPLERFDDRENM